MEEVEWIVPQLEMFRLHEDIPFLVVDPSGLPVNIKDALDEFMIGQTVPHNIYIYSHDYEFFRQLVQSGCIKVD